MPKLLINKSKERQIAPPDNIVSPNKFVIPEAKVLTKTPIGQGIRMNYVDASKAPYQDRYAAEKEAQMARANAPLENVYPEFDIITMAGGLGEVGKSLLQNTYKINPLAKRVVGEGDFLMNPKPNWLTGYKVAPTLDDIIARNQGLRPKLNKLLVKDRGMVYGNDEALVNSAPIAYETHPKGEMILYQDMANPAHHFFDANMPGQPLQAGRSFNRLMTKVPVDGYVEEAGTLSLDALKTTLKQTTKPGFKGELPGTKISLNNSAFIKKLPGTIDNGKSPITFDSYFKARAGAKEVTKMYQEFGFPKAKATLYRSNMDTQFGINVPNIRLSRVPPVKDVSGITLEDFKKVNWYKELTAIPNGAAKNARTLLGEVQDRLRTPEGIRRAKSLGVDSRDLNSSVVIDSYLSPAYHGTTSIGNGNVFGISPILKNPDVRPIMRHEIEHSFQKVNSLDTKMPTVIDDILKDLELQEPLKNVTQLEKAPTLKQESYLTKLRNDENAADYFNFGNRKGPSLERAPMLAEVQQYALDQGLTKHPYDPVTPDKVREIFNFYQSSPKEFPLRIFNIMQPSDNNMYTIAKGLNRMLSVPAAGLAAKTLIPKKKAEQ